MLSVSSGSPSVKVPVAVKSPVVSSAVASSLKVPRVDPVTFTKVLAKALISVVLSLRTSRMSLEPPIAASTDASSNNA